MSLKLCCRKDASPVTQTQEVMFFFFFLVYMVSIFHDNLQVGLWIRMLPFLLFVV